MGSSVLSRRCGRRVTDPVTTRGMGEESRERRLWRNGASLGASRGLRPPDSHAGIDWPTSTRGGRMSEAPTWIRWETLTKRQFDAIDRKNAVVFVTCSPLEVHGPHLPLGADMPRRRGTRGAHAALPARAHRGRDLPEAAVRLRGVRRRAAARHVAFRPVDHDRACSKTSVARSPRRASRT